MLMDWLPVFSGSSLVQKLTIVYHDDHKCMLPVVMTTCYVTDSFLTKTIVYYSRVTALLFCCYFAWSVGLD